MNNFEVVEFIFIKIYVYNFLINIFIEKRKSKLCFGDRIAILNVF
jgi:hypothetical protein